MKKLGVFIVLISVIMSIFSCSVMAEDYKKEFWRHRINDTQESIEEFFSKYQENGQSSDSGCLRWYSRKYKCWNEVCPTPTKECNDSFGDEDSQDCEETNKYFMPEWPGYQCEETPTCTNNTPEPQVTPSAVKNTSTPQKTPSCTWFIPTSQRTPSVTRFIPTPQRIPSYTKNAPTPLKTSSRTRNTPKPQGTSTGIRNTLKPQESPSGTMNTKKPQETPSVDYLEESEFYNTVLFTKLTTDSELTLINGELEKARQKLISIRNEAKGQINAEIKKTREKLDKIVSNEKMNSKDKDLEIKKVKSKLKLEVERIESNVKEQAKEVIEKQNLRINSILRKI